MEKDLWLSELDGILHEVRALLMRKHHDYGSENLLRHGEYGIIVRIDDKTSRVSALLQQERRVEDESLRDTWMDVVGYGLQALALFHKEEVLKDHVEDRNESNDPVGSGGECCLCGGERRDAQISASEEVRRDTSRDEKPRSCYSRDYHR